MKILAMYSIKGGVGKTASAVNIAYWAARAGYRTLLLDLDSQGASSFYFRVKPAASKNWGKRFFKAYEQVLKQIKASDFENLDVIPAHLSFRNFDVMLEQLGAHKNRLRQALKGLKREYDLVILDCPPTISRLAESIFKAADLVLVPVIPTTLSERTFDQLADFFKDEDYGRKKLIPFFTMVDSRKQLHRETAVAMRKRYKRFLRNAIPHSADVEKMGIHRAPIDVYAHGRQANRAYQALWQEIAALLREG
ncbi:ParA family protein [Pelobacter seleniigenes]|uniref:ParA family protein n=1 Tax=Pelobacter seleniigenes TaxID=407188 RepID=UPI0004A6F490|nr:AAA family ATPase [Pelobacter seleniigenes]